MMQTAQLPTSLGPYTLLRRLAAGGMAEVYLARAEGVDGFEKLVAIKRLHPAHSPCRDGSASGLVDEAKLSVALSHPNIVQIFDLGRAEGTDFIVMEHVEGYDAQHVLDCLAGAGESFPAHLAAYVMAEVCRGLDYAHRFRDVDGRHLGIVHRDVSPQNVLLSAAGEVKIADFGIARTSRRKSDPEAKVIKGKYFYMSPEQACARALDERSDVFSVGVVLWELLAGRRLYQAPDVRSLLEAVRKAEVPAPSSVRRTVPAELDAIVARATIREVSGRFPSARALAEALDGYLATRPPRHYAGELRSLLARLPPPEAPAAAGPTAEVPRTRDRRTTVPGEEQRTLPSAPLLHALEESEPTLAGWQSPVARTARDRWLWALCAGAALVAAVAWVVHAG